MFTAALLCVVFAIIFLYLRHIMTVWQRKGIPYIPPKPLVGNLGPMATLKISAAEHFANLYEQTKKHRFVGIYNFFRPTLLINDPLLVRDMLVKDFQHFHDRGTYVDEENDPLSGHLFSLAGDKWRHLRAKLTPTFTSGKLKAMFGTLLEVGDELEKYVEKATEKDEVIEIRDLMARYLTDVIVSVAFGLKIDSINDPHEKFREMGRKFFTPNLLTAFRIMTLLLAPKLNKSLRLRFVDRDIEKFIIDMVRQNMEYREENNVTRKDFFQLLLQLRNTGTVQLDEEWEIKMAEDQQKRMTVNEMGAQAFVFFVAGFETSSSAMSFCLYEMAKNPEVQRKAQESIDQVLKQHGGKITYDSIQEMTYLENCLSETLRIYPSVPLLNRECTQAYKIPNSDVTIEQGTAIVVALRGLHMDPNLFPDPNSFRPERFEEESQLEAIKLAYQPFGQGPRICIGMRLAKMTSKVGLALLLSKFNFEFAPGYDSSMVFDPALLAMSPKGGINLKISLRK